ncbi:hypothetical protein Tco_1412116, partial [Tanacetum coccineum]
HRSRPRAHRTPILTTASPHGKKMKQSAEETSSPQKLLKFVASMIHNDDDDSGDRIEPGSHKEHSEVVVVDDDNQKEKKDDEMGSLENKTEKMQTPIPTTPRSPRINLSSDKDIAQKLTDNVFVRFRKIQL